MPDKEKAPPAASAPPAVTEANNPDVQAALKALLGVYQPILEQQLSLAKNADELQKQAQAAASRTCAEEFAEAYTMFSKFLTEETTSRLLPAKAKELLGPIDQWRWCLQHILCCMVFGWLVCRWPRTFKGYAYYLYEFWKCVRQVVGDPVSDPPTADQRRDFEILVAVLAGAFKPYLTDQLATVEYPAGIPDAIFAGNIDCSTDDQEACNLFNRLLTTEAANALLGSAAFKAQSQKPYFWFCRCWCLCALCFGCCLARARNLQQVVLCLYAYYRCLIDCFQPLICQITSPAENSCAGTITVAACAGAVAVQITGSAAGSSFDYYTLQYAWGGGSPVGDAVIYPDCGRPPGSTSSSVPVNSGTLGYIDVFLLPPGQTDFTVYLDVYDASGGHIECTTTFQLAEKAIQITAVAEVNVQPAPDPFQPASPPPAPIKLIPAAFAPGFELSVGGSFSVTGSAYTVGCNRIMNQFELLEFPLSPLGSLPPPVGTYTSGAGGVPLLPGLQPVVYADTLAHPWSSGCVGPIPNIIEGGNLVAYWGTETCWQFLGGHWVSFTKPQVLPVPYWNSLPLNGRFVILLEVRDHQISPPEAFPPGDVAGVDYVVAWIDNQQIVGQIYSVGGLTGCGDLVLSNYVSTPAVILGQAWDPPIDATAKQQQPNDNFGQYTLTFQKNGDPLASGTITTSTSRVPNLWPGPLLPLDLGTLANWDIVSALDGGTGPLPLHSPKLLRGTRCAYIVTLVVTDTTHVGDGGDNHTTGEINYAFEVINDLGP